MIVRRPGNEGRNRRCTSIMAISSPAWVDVAATTGRSPIASFSALSLSASVGGAGTSSFRLPVTTACGAPSCVKRFASRPDCARQSSKRPSSAFAVPWIARQRWNDRSETRPFTRISGIRRFALAMIRFGQISDSANNARSGCQRLRNCATKRGVSSGTNWWITSGGNRSRARLAEVTVPEVTRTPKPIARSRWTRGRTASNSPTLAPWTQISGPSGRSVAVSPRRSIARAGFSLPRFVR